MPGYPKLSRFVLKTGKYISCRAIHFFSVSLFLIFCSASTAQRVMIDSLRKVLPSLQDSARVDCLNLLSLAYAYIHTDTAKSYSLKAHSEASSIHYRRGMAMSLNNEARIAGHGLRDFQRQEKISVQALQLYKHGRDHHVMAETHMNLALALFSQGKFDRSSEACLLAIRHSQKAGDKKGEGEALAILGSISFESGSYERSFEYYNGSLEVFKSIQDSYNTAIVLVKMGDLYRLAGDHQTAMNFYLESLAYPKGPSLMWHPLADLGDTYYTLIPYEPASYQQEKYIETIKSLTVRSNYIIFAGMRMAEIHIASKQYDKALPLLLKELKPARERNDRNQVMRLLLDISRCYKGKQDYPKAIYFAKELVRSALSHKAGQYIRDGYQLMSVLYDHQHRVDSAYFYYRQYTSMKDSISFDDFSKRLAVYKASTENEKKQAQIVLLRNEKLINRQELQIREQQLNSASFHKNILFGCLLGAGLIGLFFFRNIILKKRNEEHRRELIEKELHLQKLESEKTKSEWQQQATELKMQALRAQMNPHFIFNSLNSINRFILQNNKVRASGYLTKFSKLIRLILQSSQVSMVPLESELAALQLYLELEAVRFDHHFTFDISVENNVGASEIKVPPLIIQPYAENAIWHGLMHKEEKGHLQINLFVQEDMLCCKISDDGVGRKKAVELKSKSPSTHKSMGMQITASRIAMLVNEKQSATQIIITDLFLHDGTSGGTEVLLKIPVCYD